MSVDDLIAAKETYEALQAELDVLRESMQTARTARATKQKEMMDAKAEMQAQLDALNGAMDAASKDAAKALIIACRESCATKQAELNAAAESAQSARSALIAKEQEVAAAQSAYEAAQAALA